MDNSRLFLFAALVFVGMLMWQQWQADYGPQPQPQVAQPATDATGEIEVPLTDDLPDQADDVGAQTSSSTGSSTSTAAAAPQGQLLRIDTDVAEAVIDTRGGVLRSLKLKKYPTSLEQPDDWLETDP